MPSPVCLISLPPWALRASRMMVLCARRELLGLGVAEALGEASGALHVGEEDGDQAGGRWLRSGRLSLSPRTPRPPAGNP